MPTFLSVSVGTVFKIPRKDGLWVKTSSNQIQGVRQQGSQLSFIGKELLVNGDTRIAVVGAGSIKESKNKPKKKKECACKAKAVGEVLDEEGITWAHKSLLDTVQSLHQELEAQKNRILALTTDVTAAVKKKNGSGSKKKPTIKMDQADNDASYQQNASQRSEQSQMPVIPRGMVW